MAWHSSQPVTSQSSPASVNLVSYNQNNWESRTGILGGSIPLIPPIYAEYKKIETKSIIPICAKLWHSINLISFKFVFNDEWWSVLKIFLYSLLRSQHKQDPTLQKMQILVLSRLRDKMSYININSALELLTVRRWTGWLCALNLWPPDCSDLAITTTRIRQDYYRVQSGLSDIIIKYLTNQTFIISKTGIQGRLTQTEFNSWYYRVWLGVINTAIWEQSTSDIF